MWLGAVTSVLFTVLAASFASHPDLSSRPDSRASGGGHGGGSPRTRRWFPSAFYDSVFWRIVFFNAALFGAGSVFRHVDSTLPKFLRRTLGAGAHYGAVYAIDPLVIIVAVPLAQSLLANADIYSCFVAGTAVTASASFVLAAFPPSYTAAIAFMLLVSAGEAVYSPRLYEYVLYLSPEGAEGSYGALLSMPLFVVKAWLPLRGCRPAAPPARFARLRCGAAAPLPRLRASRASVFFFIAVFRRRRRVCCNHLTQGARGRHAPVGGCGHERRLVLVRVVRRRRNGRCTARAGAALPRHVAGNWPDGRLDARVPVLFSTLAVLGRRSCTAAQGSHCSSRCCGWPLAGNHSGQ